MASRIVERPDRAGPATMNAGVPADRSGPSAVSSSPPTPARAHSGPVPGGRSRQASSKLIRAGQHVDPERPPGAGTAASRSAAQPAIWRSAAAWPWPRGVRGEQRHLGLGAGPGAECPAGRRCRRAGRGGAARPARSRPCSASLNTSLSSHMAAIRPASSDRSPVITRWIPALAPSARIRVITSVRVPPLGSPSVVVKPSHRSSSTRMCGSRSAGRAAARCSAIAGEAARREQVLPPGQLGGQPGQQPRRPLVLGAGDHRAAVRQLGERQQRAVAAVHAVQVHVGAAERERERPRRWCAAAGTARTAARPPPSGGRRCPGRWPRAAALQAGQIDQAERDGRVPRRRRPARPGAAGAGRSRSSSVGRQRCQPRAGLGAGCPGRRRRGGSLRPGPSDR